MMNDSYIRRKFNECEQLRAENRWLSTALGVQTTLVTIALICMWIWG